MKDYATSLIITAPSPATSGTSLTVQSGHGDRFPDAPFLASIHPALYMPDLDNAEKVRVTAKAGDTFTIERALSPTTAKTVQVGYRITNALFVEDIADLNTVDSVNGQIGTVVLDTDDVSDSGATNKYVTAAEKTKLSNLSGVNTGDQDLSGLVPNTRTVNGKALSSNITLDKTDVGLGNVDNTSDANKPISTATQTALDEKPDTSDVAIIARPTVSASLLDLPTPDGNPAVTHPSVVEAPNGSWNGYRYWMAMTPYPTEPRENPCVLASNDLRNWEIPNGGSNPVVPLSEAISAGYEYGSDTELIFVDGNTLMMFYRFAVSTTPPLKEIIYYKTSTDGVTWSSQMPTGLSNGSRNDTLLSPAVIRLANGDLAMYTVNASGSYGVVERRISTDNGVTWGSPTTCSTPNDHSPWHVAIRLIDGVYYLLSCDRNPSAATVLVFMTSTDGINFTGDTGWSVPLSGNTYDAGGYYRSTFIPSSTKFGGMLSFDVFATVMNAGKTSHRVALFEAVTPNREAKLTRSDNGVSVLTDKSRILFADSFSRKSASGIGSPDIGSAWERYQSSGTNSPTITNGKVKFGSTISQGIMVSNCGVAYGTLSALVTLPASGSTDGGLVMCAGTSNSDFLQIAVARDAATYNQIAINTHISGAVVTVASNDNVNLQYGTTYKVEASLNKSGTVKVFLDGQFVLSYTLTAPQLALFSGLTRHGIYSHFDAVTSYGSISFSSSIKSDDRLSLSAGSSSGLEYLGGEGFIKLQTTNGLRLTNDAAAQFRLLPVVNNVYFQNTVSTGDMYFTGLNGGDLTGNAIFKTTSSVRPGTNLVASLGTTGAYWTSTYSRMLYLNPTAYLDGTTPGVAAMTGALTVTGSITGSNISGTNTGDQTASTVQNTPAGNIAATNVQTALNELDTEKVAKAGDTMGGNLATLRLAPILDLTYDIGTASLYYNSLYARRHYMNSTAFIDGATAGKLTVTGQFLSPNGASATPSYSFVNSTGSGMFLNGASGVVIAQSGTDTLGFKPNIIQMSSSGVMGFTSGTTVGTIDSGLSRTGAAAFALGNGTAGNASGSLSLGGLVVDTSTLVVDAANDRVGVGTASPNIKFHVVNGAVTSSLGATPATRGMAITGADGSSRLYFESTTATSGRRVFAINNEAGQLNVSSLNDAGTSFTNANVLSIGYNGLIGVGTAAPTAAFDIKASTTSNSALRLRSGTAPTSPNDGDIWFDGTDLKMHVGGVTKTFTLV